MRAPAAPFRTVVAGDTLYSIAWESGRDYRELARWNRIPAPYTIKPGQQLRVTPPGDAEKPGARVIQAKPGKPASRPATKPVSGTTGKNKTASPAASPATPKVAHNNKRTATNAKPAKHAKAIAGKKTAGRTNVVSGGWAWPTDGKLLNRYSESDSKGLDFAGARGDPVRAAADGRVVYQGSGLRGYGQLIIVKHNDEFLSAYAHNDRIHVKEGESVKRGQKIADMGSSGTDRTKLHFEIRRHGAPVDPLSYLPKR